VAIPASQTAPLWLISPRDGFAFEVYINGEFAGKRGSLPPNLNFRKRYIAAFALP
jgi:hypothetical protein